MCVCVCVCAEEWVRRRKYLFFCVDTCMTVDVKVSVTVFHPPPFFLSGRRPQKWPVRALGNVDAQIMTRWEPWTSSLSPAGNWFFYQFIVSSCTAHHRYSCFRNRGEERERKRDRDKYEHFHMDSERLQVHISLWVCVPLHLLMIIWHFLWGTVGKKNSSCYI